MGASGHAIGPARSGARRHQRTRWWRRERVHLGALLPAALLLGLFFVLPAIWAFYTSMTDYALMSRSARDPRFIGLENYRRLWHDPDFPRIVRNTAVFVTGAAVIGQTGLGLALALLIEHATARGYRLANVAFGCLLLAWISPPLMTGFIWSRMLAPIDGTLNGVLAAVGLSPVDPLANHAMTTVIVVEVWRGVAFATVILLGALQTIPRQIYEAARVDGMGAVARFRDHTLPLLRPILALVLMMTTISASGSFLMILLLTAGGPGNETQTIALFSYLQAFGAPPFEIAFGAAISVVLLLLNLIFAVVYLALARRRT